MTGSTLKLQPTTYCPPAGRRASRPSQQTHISAAAPRRTFAARVGRLAATARRLAARALHDTVGPR